MAIKENVVSLKNKLHTLSVAVARAAWLSRLGQQYGTKRNLWDALGYKLILTYEDFAAYYERNEMAKAIINRPVEATWQGAFGISESTKGDETKLEKAWNDLNIRIPMKSVFSRLDKLSLLGRYGVLFLGFDDAKRPADFSQPVQQGKGRKLMYVKPFGEGNALISTYETNATSERYGLPLIYDLNVIDASGQKSTTISAHYSRIIHVPGETLESEYLGVPVLQVVFNRLMDLEKLVGGSAEMFWRGARPGYAAKIDKEYQLSTDTENGLKDQIDEYEHNLRRILAVEGIDLNMLAMQVADPKGHVDVQIQMISAVTGIPKRILTGSELGELASSEDTANWLSRITARRSEYAELQIVRPFVDTMVKVGSFPPAGDDGYSVQWDDLFAASDKDQAEVGRVRSEALKNYTMSPTAESVVPPEAFFQYFLGFDEDQITVINEMRDKMVKEEQASAATPEEEALLKEEQAKQGGQP